MESVAVNDVVAILTIDSSDRLYVKVAEGFNSKEQATAILLRYFAEGNANIIFSIEIIPDTQGNHGTFDNILTNKLLRVPKLGRGRWSGPDTEAEREFKGSDLVNQEEVLLDSPALKRLNEHLDQPAIRGKRKSREGQLCDASSPLQSLVRGILVIDMRPKRELDQVMLNFKPKWLAQSPTAPKNARRCRTCALQADQGSDQTTHLCPLALATGKIEHVHKQISVIVDNETSSPSDPLLLYKEHLAQYFTYGIGREILQRLKELQVQNDPHGIQFLECVPANEIDWPSDQHHVIRKLAKAMTFRDCSIYVRITPPKPLHDDFSFEDFRYEARLGDVDRKLPEHTIRAGGGVPEQVGNKLMKWSVAERKLLEGGYYAGTEELRMGHERHESCILWGRE